MNLLDIYRMIIIWSLWDRHDTKDSIVWLRNSSAGQPQLRQTNNADLYTIDTRIFFLEVFFFFPRWITRILLKKTEKKEQHYKATTNKLAVMV